MMMKMRSSPKNQGNEPVVKASDKSEYRGDAASSEDDAKSLQDIRKTHIQHVLEMAKGNIETAADLLEIPVSELRRWMTKLGIE
jgi:transcriptional regulator with PAS, ATPase and Fis domain